MELTILVLIIALAITVSIGGFLAYGSHGNTVIPVLIELYPDGEIIEGQYIITDSLFGKCYPFKDTLIGCASRSSATMYILRSDMDFVRSVTGYDIFTHEYLHIRCEYNDWDYNWHVANGEDAVYYSNVNYWETCGRGLTQIQNVSENTE